MVLPEREKVVDATLLASSVWTVVVAVPNAWVICGGTHESKLRNVTPFTSVQIKLVLAGLVARVVVAARRACDAKTALTP